MNAAFYNAVRPMFGGSLTQSQVDGFEIIAEAWTKCGDGDLKKLAYILATAKHETANTMQPVRETLAKTDAKAKEILTKAWKTGKLPWVKSDYWTSGFFGRGYVQLTHRENYQKAGAKLGLDLVSDPSKAMIPEVAALILVRGMLEGWFTGKTLADYGADFVGMRKVVNGTDRAALIAGYAVSFLDALQASQKPQVTPKPVPAPSPAPVPSPASRSILEALWRIVVSVVGAVMKGMGKK